MLEIEIPETEFFDESKSEFIYVKAQKIQLEHSLISISKWESKWKKPFLTEEAKSNEEFIDYVRCMTMNKNVDPRCYDALSAEHIKLINDYISDDMTATWFNERGPKNTSKKEIITSEVVYYWMIKIGIPVEFEKWHINRLLTLIRVYSAKEGGEKKMGKNEILSMQSELNRKRRAAMNSKG